MIANHFPRIVLKSNFRVYSVQIDTVQTIQLSQMPKYVVFIIILDLTGYERASN